MRALVSTLAGMTSELTFEFGRMFRRSQRNLNAERALRTELYAEELRLRLRHTDPEVKTAITVRAVERQGVAASQAA